jgi:hypothetical protein
MYLTPIGVAPRFKYAPAYLSLVPFLLGKQKKSMPSGLLIKK